MKMKYVGKECHFIRDEIVRGVITPRHFSTAIQLYDILQLEGGIKIDMDAYCNYQILKGS